MGEIFVDKYDLVHDDVNKDYFHLNSFGHGAEHRQTRTLQLAVDVRLELVVLEK